MGPTVPDDLRQICEADEREIANIEDIQHLMLDLTLIGECANGKITAVDAILTDFEERIAEHNAEAEAKKNAK